VLQGLAGEAGVRHTLQGNDEHMPYLEPPSPGPDPMPGPPTPEPRPPSPGPEPTPLPPDPNPPTI
jgi:hypothetical protein